jgi:hypothetical protein
MLLSASEIRLSYGWQTLLDGVTLAIEAGKRGRNRCFGLSVGGVSVKKSPVRAGERLTRKNSRRYSSGARSSPDRFEREVASLGLGPLPAARFQELDDLAAARRVYV